LDSAGIHRGKPINNRTLGVMRNGFWKRAVQLGTDVICYCLGYGHMRIVKNYMNIGGARQIKATI